MLKKILLASLVILTPSLVQGQATPTSKLGFSQPAPTLTEAQNYTYKYYPDGATTGVVVTVTCTGTASPFDCQFPFPAFTPGNHTVTLTASNIAGESAKSTPFAFVFVVTPATPTGIRIIQ